MKDIILAILGSGALSALISGCLNMINKKRERKCGVDKAIQLLLLGEIKREGRQYISDKKIGLEDLQAFNEIYQTYKDMGGNGYADAVKAKVTSLPIVVEEVK